MDVGGGERLKVVLSVDPVKFPLTGIGRYTYELGKGLQREGLDSLRFLRGYHVSSELPEPDAAQPMARTPAWKRRAQQSRVAVAAYSQIHSWLQSRALKGLADHVYHGPNFYLPRFAGRSVATFHDLSCYLWPHCHPPERVRYMEAEIELALQRASALITDTEYTRQEVARYFAWPLERIHAVPLASAAEFHPRTPVQLQPVLATLGLEAGGYTLYAGTIEPRKNIATLLDAYAQLAPSLRQQWPLVVAGYRGWNSAALHERLQQGQAAGWVRYLGYVDHGVLPHLMAGARLFAYPSWYEGFGLPVLEAMASGVPVVCSNASTLPEVAANAALFHDPADADALRQALQIGLHDEAWRAQARAEGLRQAGRFSWQRCAQQTLQVYRTVLAG